MDNRSIGIFDSGVGGLTVVSEIMKKLPNEQIVYFGDTARLPYGNKSKEAVTRFSRQIVRFLLTKDVKAIIIACNTASSNSLDILKKEFQVPIFGVVKPGVWDAVHTTVNNKIGVIGTSATVRSKAYKKFIHEKNKNIDVYSKACPLFVPLVEERWTGNEVAQLVAEGYLNELIEKGIDTLVLGCTHYPLLKNCIKKTVGENIKLVDPAVSTAFVVHRFLKENDSLRVSNETAEHVFYVSDKTDKFEMICEDSLHRAFVAVEIDIEEY